MSQNSPEAIVSFLKHNEMKNMNMLYFMKNNPVCSLERTGDSVVLRGESDHPWVYISSPDEQELTAVIKTLTSNDRFFAVIEDWMLPSLTAGKTLVWQLSTVKLVLPEDVIFPEMPQSCVTPLSASDAQYLYDHSLYREVTSANYIRNRIQNGLTAGIYEAGKLVAWALTHDDSAIGFLHVLPAYRRKGYAYKLTAYLISQLRKQGKIPFVQIEEANLKSIHLAAKLGFKKDRTVHWFEIQLECHE